MYIHNTNEIYELGQENTIGTFKSQHDGRIRYKKECYRCGKTYHSTRIDSLTCSKSCSNAINRLRDRGITPTLGKKWLTNKPNPKKTALEQKLISIETELGNIKQLLEQVLKRQGG